MKIRDKKILKPLLYSAVAFGVLAAGLAFLVSPQRAAVFDNAGNYGSGFAPGTVISYQVVSSKGVVQDVQEIADQRGTFRLPAVPQNKASAQETLAYHLKIESPDKKDPVDVALKVDPKKKKVSLKGTGWEQFAAVKLDAGHDTLDIKSDWAGVLDAPEAARVDEGAPVRLAFQGMNLSDDMRDDRTPYIEIQALGPQGKGGKCDNKETGEECGDVNKVKPTGDKKLSTYDKAEINDRIENAKENFDKSIEMMGNQMTASTIQDSLIMGSFIDARIQLRQQRRFQELTARAHSTYHPGEEMCRFGTYTRSLAASEDKARKNKGAMNSSLIDRYLNIEGTAGAAGVDSDVRANNEQLREEDCDSNSAGMEGFCENSGSQPNSDIDYTSGVQAPLTVDVDFSDSATTPAESQVMKLAKNLYWPGTMPPISESEIEKKGGAYLDQRAVMATAALAHNSFVNLVAAKSAGTGSDAEQGGAYMKSMLRELGIEDEEIHALLGDNPSYFAQMDVLTQKVYQSPGFYTRLYERPANVERLATAMDAIKLMNGRDRFESILRQEVLASQLLAQALQREQEKVNTQMINNMRNINP